MENLLFKLADVNMEPIEGIQLRHPERLLGQLCINRVGGIAYRNLEKIDGLDTHNEFINTLKAIYEQNLQKTDIFFQHMRYVTKILKNADFAYALLKGALLTTKLYEKGLRTSNDLDILIEEKDISKCQKLFIENGFVQGSYERGKGIIPATRSEILMSRMNYGETIPLVKIVEGELLQVDINFSVDFKPVGESNIVNKLLENCVEIEKDDIKFYTLDLYEFLIHLSCHLYKEATTYDWVKDNRDLQLYKFSDINVFVQNYGTLIFFRKFMDKVRDYGVEKECYYTLYNMREIFPKINKVVGFKELLEKMQPDDCSFMKQIIEPVTGKLYAYKMDFIDWFLNEKRTSCLKEVM